jgi:hypothetical protein
MTGLIILMIGSVVATIVIISTSVLSSRINHCQPEAENYEAVWSSQTSQEITLRTYSIKLNA